MGASDRSTVDTANTSEEIQQSAISASLHVPKRKRSANVKHVLDTFKHLPDYLQDNEFIVGSYRKAGMPFGYALKSILRLHNESGNIWTHLIGFFIFAALTLWIAYSPPSPLVASGDHVANLWNSQKDNFNHLSGNINSIEHNIHLFRDNFGENLLNFQENLQQYSHQLQDSIQYQVSHLQDNIQTGALALKGNLQHVAEKLQEQLEFSLSSSLQWPTVRWPAYVFMAGAMTCLLLSSICHLLGCCSRHISQFLWRLDYTGIAILIVTSFYPAVYYGFLCEPFWRTTYLSGITLLGMATVFVSLVEKFQSTKYRAFRASLFAGLGLFGIVPIVHQYFLHPGVWHVMTVIVLDVLMGVIYLLGAAIYSLRVPERWLPGSFDLLLHSHQIFHIAVVVAALVHYRAVMLLLEWRDVSGGCALAHTQPLGHTLAEMERGGGLTGVENLIERLMGMVLQHVGLSHSHT